jgi:hypothetical protein
LFLMRLGSHMSKRGRWETSPEFLIAVKWKEHVPTPNHNKRRPEKAGTSQTKLTGWFNFSRTPLWMNCTPSDMNKDKFLSVSGSHLGGITPFLSLLDRDYNPLTPLNHGWAVHNLEKITEQRIKLGKSKSSR